MLKEKASSALRRRRKTLLARASKLGASILRGSLIERYKRCGKAGCKCAEGRGHGPKYYLSVSQPGKTPEMDYVPIEHLDKVKRHLKNFYFLRELLEEICAINRELLRRREEL